MPDIPFLKFLADTGILGIVLAISITGNYLLFKLIQQIQEKRIDDAKEVTEGLSKPLGEIKKNSDITITLLQQMLSQDAK